MQIHVFNDNHKKFKKDFTSRCGTTDFIFLQAFLYSSYSTLMHFCMDFMHSLLNEEKQSVKSTSHFEIFFHSVSLYLFWLIEAQNCWENCSKNSEALPFIFIVVLNSWKVLASVLFDFKLSYKFKNLRKAFYISIYSFVF